MNKADLYALRKKRKRWLKELEGFEAELAEKLEFVKKHGRWSGPGTVEYPQERIKTLKTQLADLDKLDLRTDEEKRGVKRKKYTRTKPAEDRGLSASARRNMRRSERRTNEELASIQFPYGSVPHQMEIETAYMTFFPQLVREDHSKFPKPVDEYGGASVADIRRAEGITRLTDKGREMAEHFYNVIVPEIDSRYPESPRQRIERELLELTALREHAVLMRRKSRETRKVVADPTHLYPATARSRAKEALESAEEATNQVEELEAKIQQGIDAGGEYAQLIAEMASETAAARKEEAREKSSEEKASAKKSRRLRREILKKLEPGNYDPS